MDSRLQYTVEEAHEMHKRVILNGVFSTQRDGQQMITSSVMEVICDSADRLLDEMNTRGLIKG